MRTLRILLLAGLSTAAWGQTLVEYGLGVAAAGTAGAGGAGSRGIAGVFSNLTKTLNSTAEAGTAAATTQPAKAAAAKAKTATATAQPSGIEATPATEPPKPVVVYEDPAGIKTGMARAELFRRFGEPMARITTGNDAESLTYGAKDRVFDVEIVEGKVYSVEPKSKPHQAGVVLLQ
jgi:hypothetical protein